MANHMVNTLASMDSTFLSASQAARVLGLSSERIRQMVKQGILPAIETPLGRLIPAEAVEQLRKDREAVNAAG